MPRIQIKQLNEKVATEGIAMGGHPRARRKLQPGEIVDLPEDLVENGVNIFEVVWATGNVEIVPPHIEVTRPLDYKNAKEARLCAPTFKPLSPTDERDMKQARAAVAARLLEQSESPVVEPESPEPDETLPVSTPPPTSKNRRAARRAAVRAAHGEANPT